MQTVGRAPASVTATERHDLQIPPRSEIQEHRAHLVAQPVARIPGRAAHVDELDMLLFPNRRRGISCNRRARDRRSGGRAPGVGAGRRCGHGRRQTN